MLEINEQLQNKVNEAMQVIGDSPAAVKTVYSSYTHASFDQASRIITGDLIWNQLVSQTYGHASFYPLTWEVQPPGDLNAIEILLPGNKQVNKASIKVGLSTLPWWVVVDEQIQESIRKLILDENKWTTAAKSIEGQLRKDYSKEFIEQLLARAASLKSLYQAVIENGAGKRLSEVSESAYQMMVMDVFGEDVASDALVNRQSYFGSELGTTVSIKATEMVKAGSMAEAVKRLRWTDQPLFIGGSWNNCLSVSYSGVAGIYRKGRIDNKSGQIDQYGGKLEVDELVELLSARQLMPVGNAFDLITLSEPNHLVVHHGSAYGNPMKMEILMPEAVLATYHQVFADKRDSYPPVQFADPKGVQRFYPSMASLYIWNLVPGLWQTKLVEALKSGTPQMTLVNEEVVNC